MYYKLCFDVNIAIDVVNKTLTQVNELFNPHLKLRR